MTPPAGDGEEPFCDPSFARAMLPFEPFEDQPLLAVALSGGGDSLALCLLADAWATARRGRIIALTVDHGLRSNSRDEAERVAEWMRGRAIEHHILTWSGAKPTSRLQQSAREARYRLLRSWCRERGVLHLVLAHTRDDQAETVLLRRQAGSGDFGQSGMAACVEHPELRILRPLLGVSRRRLRAALEAAGQPWIDDPSNDDVRFARVRARQSLADDREQAEALWRSGREKGEERQAVEGALCRLAAQSLTLGSQGYARVTTAALRDALPDLQARFWGGVLAAIGGRAFAPDGAASAVIAAWLAEPGAAGGRTLGGCRITASAGTVLVTREIRNMPVRRPLQAGDRLLWDGRFRVEAGDSGCDGRYFLGHLGSDGWARIGRRPAAPRPAVMALPAVWEGEDVVEVPTIGFRRNGAAGVPVLHRCIFSPRNAVAGIGFLLASPCSAIISCSDDAGVTSPRGICPPGVARAGRI